MSPSISSSMETSQRNKNIQEKKVCILLLIWGGKKCNVAILIISAARKKRQGKNKFTLI